MRIGCAGGTAHQGVRLPDYDLYRQIRIRRHPRKSQQSGWPSICHPPSRRGNQRLVLQNDLACDIIDTFIRSLVRKVAAAIDVDLRKGDRGNTPQCVSHGYEYIRFRVSMTFQHQPRGDIRKSNQVIAVVIWVVPQKLTMLETIGHSQQMTRRRKSKSGDQRSIANTKCVSHSRLASGYRRKPTELYDGEGTNIAP